MPSRETTRTSSLLSAHFGKNIGGTPRRKTLDWIKANNRYSGSWEDGKAKGPSGWAKSSPLPSKLLIRKRCRPATSRQCP